MSTVPKTTTQLLARWYLLHNEHTGYFLYRRIGVPYGRLRDQHTVDSATRTWDEPDVPDTVKEVVAVIDIAGACDLGHKSGDLYMISDAMAAKIRGVV